MVLGKGTVGKTSLIFRYVNNCCPKEHDATVEDSYSVHIDTKNGEQREFKILDTAGEEDYQNMLDQWISQASGFLLIFAINDMETFDSIDVKVKRIKQNNAEKLPIVLVGNKCDLKTERKVTIQQAEEYAKSIGAKYFETSALTDENGNCKVVFRECANMIMNKSSIDPEAKKGCALCNIF